MNLNSFIKLTLRINLHGSIKSILETDIH